MFFAQSIFFFFCKACGQQCGENPKIVSFFSAFQRSFVIANLGPPPPLPPTNPDTFLKRTFYTLTETALQSGVFYFGIGTDLRIRVDNSPKDVVSA